MISSVVSCKVCLFIERCRMYTMAEEALMNTLKSTIVKDFYCYF